MYKDRHKDECNRIESPEIYTSMRKYEWKMTANGHKASFVSEENV